jgi:hypothetical protein
MAMVPSRAQIAKSGTRSFNAAQIQAVLAAATEKKDNRTLSPTDLEAIMASHQDTEEELWDGPPDEAPEDVATGLLITSAFWSTVHQNEIMEDIRWTLPHAHSMMNNRKDNGQFEVWPQLDLPPVYSSYDPPEEEELWTEESGVVDYSNGWCLASCPRRTDGTGRMLYCEWGSCKGRCFHLGCVGLTRVPKGMWLCPDCSVLSKKRPQWRDRSAFRFNFKINEDSPPPPSPSGLSLHASSSLEVTGVAASWAHPKPSWLRPPKKVRPSVIWNKGERFTKTTEKRQRQMNFIKKQIKGYVDLFLGGRSTKTVGLAAGGEFDPTTKCPACKCLHAGGIRCYLGAEEDELFLSVFVRPFGKTIKSALKAKNTAKKGEAVGLEGLGRMEDD